MTVTMMQAAQWNSVSREGSRSGGHQASAWVPFKLWQRGVEVPTLVSENPAAVELCLAILAGSLVDYPEIFVSEAVAVQIYLLSVV